MAKNETLQNWFRAVSQGSKTALAFAGTLALITLALNQVGSMGFRYGKAAAYKQGAYACEQRPIAAQNEDAIWLIRESL